MVSKEQAFNLEKEIKELPPEWITLVSTNNANYIKSILAFLKLIHKKKAYAIYLSVNRPYNNLINTLKFNKIKYDRIYFIDCVTETAGGVPNKSERVLYLSGPQNLTDLGVAIDELLHLLKNKKKVYFILDSVSTLLIYNNKSSVTEFVHFITSKLRLFNVNGAIINIEEQDDDIGEIIMQFCDKELKVM